MRSRKSRRENKTIRTPHQQQRAAVWQYVAAVAIVLVVVGSVYWSVSAMPASPSENSAADLAQATLTPSPSARWTNDTPVLAFDDSQKSWRTMRLGQLEPRQEFQLDGHLYFLNLDKEMRENPRVEVSRLAEADRGFEPGRWRDAEPQDVVRFVADDNRHWRHDLALTAEAGDRFVFQGLVYECATAPDDPAYVVCLSTDFVQNGEGRIVTTQEYALAAGYGLDEVYGRAPQSAPPAAPASATIAEPSGAHLLDLAAQAAERNRVQTPLNTAANSIVPGPTAPNVGDVGLMGQPRQSAAGATSSGPGGMPTDYLFTGQRWDAGVGLYDYGARFYDPALGRFISADPIVPQPGNPQDLNRYAYARNNPLRYTDPDGHTVRSALDLIREYRDDIKTIAQRYALDSTLLAGVVFAENRNDYNWIRGEDWSGVFTLGLIGGPEVKNIVGPLVKTNPSTGITEMSIAVTAMMDNPNLVPDNYKDMSRDDRSKLHEQIAAGLSGDERKHILGNLSDPKMSLEYAAKYLKFLGNQREYDNQALWLSDYNRGLSDWDTTTEYGRRIDVYRKNIEQALNWQEPQQRPICVGTYGCAALYDRLLYGELP